MYMFRERLRAVEPMNAVLKGVSDDDLKAMAELINKLPAPISPEGNTDPARMDQGRTLGAQNRCNICHRSDYHGEQNVPRLAGQREDYLLKALREYKANTRRGYDAAMADVLTSVSDEQIRDLAYYLSRLR